MSRTNTERAPHYPSRPLLMPMTPPSSRQTYLRDIAKGYSVIPCEVRSVRVDNNTEAFSEPHVVLDFERHSVELPPGYAYEEIREAVKGGCYYRSEYLDQAGHVDICVVHKETSNYELGGNSRDQFRKCTANDWFGDWNRATIKADEEYNKAVAAYEEYWSNRKKRSLWARIIGK